MAVHIIDANNPLPPASGEREPALGLGDGDIVILAPGSEIAAYGPSSAAIQGGVGTTMFLDGRVFGTWTAIFSHGAINIGASGDIRGVVGLFLQGDREHGRPNTVTNAGHISGSTASAVSLFGGHSTVVNSGSIVGRDGIWLTPFTGSDAVDNTLRVVNSGLIEATGWSGYAIRGSDYGSNVVINTGELKGLVILHGPTGSTNVYDGRGGTVTGTVYFTNGNDVAYGGDGSEKFQLGSGVNYIDGGAGSDWLFYSDWARAGASVDLHVTTQQQTAEGTWDTIRNVENISGSDGADHFIGNDDDNIFQGWAGNDTIEGSGGIDVVKYIGRFSDYTLERRGDGSFVVTDRVSGDGFNDGSDLLSGVEYLQFADRTIALAPTNSAPSSMSLSATSVGGSAPAGTVVGTLSGTDPDGDPLGYFLVANPGNHFRIHGNQLLVDRAFAGETRVEIVVRASDPSGASIDRLFSIDVTTGQISSGVGTRNLKGGRSGDALTGGAGDDTLNGGLGRDKLIGGAGQDTFAFTTKLGPGNVDRIVDFKHADDTITLAKTVFGNIRKGALSKDAFWTGAHAHDRSDRIIYNSKTGALSYDADGSETKYDPIRFAQLKPMTLLKADDFFVV